MSKADYLDRLKVQCPVQIKSSSCDTQEIAANIDGLATQYVDRFFNIKFSLCLGQ